MANRSLATPTSLYAIVIPVYNAEKYLAECLDSVLGQTYKNIKIVAVDDGSTDLSSQILEDYAQRDARLTVVHKKNEGVAVARNRALKAIKQWPVLPDFIQFLDADDRLAKDCVSTFVEALVVNKVDYAICAFQTFTRLGMKAEAPPAPMKMRLQSEEVIEQFFRITPDGHSLPLDTCTSLFLMNRSFRYQRIKDIFFDEKLRCMEDQDWLIRCLPLLSSAIQIKEILFFYRRRYSSLSNSRAAKVSDCFVLERFFQRLSTFSPAMQIGIQHSFYTHMFQELLWSMAHKPLKEAKKKFENCKMIVSQPLMFSADRKARKVRAYVKKGWCYLLLRSYARRAVLSLRRVSNRFRYFP